MYNKELKDIVEGLKAKRIIKKDVDICASTGFSNTVVSNYLNGKVKASRNFIDKFEEAYNVKIFEKKIVNSSKNSTDTETKFTETGDNNYYLHTLIKSNESLSEAKKIDSQAGLLLAQTNASLTAQVIGAINKNITNDPEVLQVLNANMRGLLAAIAKVATGTRFESEETALSELGKIVHEKHRKSKAKGSLSGVGN